MKLCILGPEKKTEFHLNLIEEAKRVFDKVLYAPLSGVRLELSEDGLVPYYKASAITNFDALLPLVSKKMALFGASVVSAVEESGIYTPISSIAINHAYNEFSVVGINRYLKVVKRGILKAYLASSRDALNAVLPKLRYPVRIKTPKKDGGSANFESEASLRSFIDAIELFSQPLLIEELRSKELAEMRILKIGKRVYCISGEREVSASKKIREVMHEVSRLMDAQTLEVSIIEVGRKELFLESINVNINLTKFERITGKDITSYLLKFVKRKARDHYERKSLLKFLDWLVELGKSTVLKR